MAGCAGFSFVIPGQRGALDPESRGGTARGSWIPGSLALLAPRNDGEGEA
jgi:hypothetical protein